MANQNEVLRVLSTKEEATSPATLAGELRAGEATVRTYLNRLKKRGYVDGGGSAWYITDAGKAALDRVVEVPTTKEDVGEDELSKFRYYGELSSITDDKIEACAELFQNTDMRSMDEMERVMAEMNVPQNQRVQWGNLYRGYLRNTTPTETRDELYPLPKPEEAAPGEEVTSVAGEPRGEQLDYIVEENDIKRVGEGLGDFTFKQALQVVAAKRGTSQKGEGEGGLLAQLDSLGLLRKSGEEGRGTQIELLDKLNDLGMLKKLDAPLLAGSYVDGEGNVQELKPGQPIVVKKVIQQAGKTYFLNPETSEVEEQETGKPIIIKLQPSPGSGSNLPPMMPFPVFGSDGEPAYDKDGKPVYANLEPMMRYMGFQDDRRRADERHSTLMGLAQTVRENIPDGIQAILATAAEIKGTGAKAPETKPEPQTFECADCHNPFAAPPGWAGQSIKCPSCGREYTKEELLG